MQGHSWNAIWSFRYARRADTCNSICAPLPRALLCGTFRVLLGRLLDGFCHVTTYACPLGPSELLSCCFHSFAGQCCVRHSHGQDKCCYRRRCGPMNCNTCSTEGSTYSRSTVRNLQPVMVPSAVIGRCMVWYLNGGLKRL